MVHARRKPAGAVRHYGVLVGSVVDGFESPDGSSPHYEIRINGGQDFRIAVNVQSMDGSEVLAFFDANFGQSGRLDLTPLLNGQRGFQALQTGPAGSGGLDYLRDNLFPIDSMQPIPAAGSGVSLSNLLDANIERAKADPTALVVAFVNFQDAGQVDKYFGFSQSRILDIHMMQGNSGSFASDNQVHGDGRCSVLQQRSRDRRALRTFSNTIHSNGRSNRRADRLASTNRQCLNQRTWRSHCEQSGPRARRCPQHTWRQHANRGGKLPARLQKSSLPWIESIPALTRLRQYLRERQVSIAPATTTLRRLILRR